MSKVEASRSYLIATALGNMMVKAEILSDFDVEDLIKNKSSSQARLLQFLNIGAEINENAQLPPETVPTIFQEGEE